MVVIYLYFFILTLFTMIFDLRQMKLLRNDIANAMIFLLHKNYGQSKNILKKR